MEGVETVKVGLDLLDVFVEGSGEWWLWEGEGWIGSEVERNLKFFYGGMWEL